MFGMARVARFPSRNPAAAAHPSVWQPSRALRELQHDLRRPLDAIRALAAEAAGQEGVPETVRSCLDRISEEAGDLLALCRHILEGPTPVVATPVVSVACSVASSCEAATGVPVEVSGPDVALAVDEFELRRALGNLLDNAARAAGPAGRVEITVEAGEEIRLGVGDSGPGFAAGPRGTSSLGLRIVHRLAGAHGGRVVVGRSRLGGALVSLVLPASLVVAGCAGMGHDRRRTTVEQEPAGVRSPVTGQGVGGAALSVLSWRQRVTTTSHVPGEGRS